MSLRDSFDTKKTSRPREFVVEDYLKAQVESIGGKCYKFVSPGYSGMPDRMGRVRVARRGGRVRRVQAPGR